MSHELYVTQYMLYNSPSIRFWHSSEDIHESRTICYPVHVGATVVRDSWTTVHMSHELYVLHHSAGKIVAATCTG